MLDADQARRACTSAARTDCTSHTPSKRSSAESTSSSKSRWRPTEADAQALIAAAEEAGVHAAVCLTKRSYPMVAELRARILAGELGQVNAVRGGFLSWDSNHDDWGWGFDPDDRRNLLCHSRFRRALARPWPSMSPAGGSPRSMPGSPRFGPPGTAMVNRSRSMPRTTCGLPGIHRRCGRFCDVFRRNGRRAEWLLDRRRRHRGRLRMEGRSAERNRASAGRRIGGQPSSGTRTPWPRPPHACRSRRPATPKVSATRSAICSATSTRRSAGPTLPTRLLPMGIAWLPSSRRSKRVHGSKGGQH